MSIKLDLKVFLFLLFFLITSQIEIYILLMLLACVHEMAHLIMGLILGFKPEELVITPVGLQISFKVKCKEYNQKILNANSLTIKRAIIAAAGPIINLIMAIISIIILKNNLNIENMFYTNITIETFIYANILIAFFNLLPIYPLDGGRIIHEILHITKGLKKAHKYTHIISKTTIISLTAITSIAILYLQNISIVIILMYLWLLVIKENRIYHNREQISRLERYISTGEKYTKVISKC